MTTSRDAGARLRDAWVRVPVLVRAIVTGLAMGAAGSVPWTLLASANQRFGAAFPWAALVMGPYLWLFWRYATGAGWPRATAESRRRNARANRVPEDAWGPALLAGILGQAGILLFQGVMGRLVQIPQQRTEDLTQYPVATVLLWSAMGAIVAGVVEETSFRGYLQRPIERRHGPLVAILVTGTLFGFAHFTHPEVGIVLLPYYLAASAVYGMLAHLTDSTLPSMVLHGGGNMLSTLGLLAGGRSELQPTAEPRPLIWQTGPDAAFFGNLAALLVVVALAVWAYIGLARLTRAARASSSG